MINFSKYLSNFLSPDRILVNCICPGTVLTESWEQSVRQIAAESGRSEQAVHEDLLHREQAKIPLGRIGSGEDISKAVLFFSSDAANWATGSWFHLNGGKMRAIS